MDNHYHNRIFQDGEELFSRVEGEIIFKLYLIDHDYVEYEYHLTENKILNVKQCSYEYVLANYGDQINLNLF